MRPPPGNTSRGPARREHRMAETTPAQQRLSPPLRDVARKDRRVLLGLSMIALFMKVTETVPSKFSTLGIELQNSGQQWLHIALALVLVYLISAFIFYARIDIKDWRIAAQEAVFNMEKIFSDLELATLEMQTREEELKSLNGGSQAYDEKAPRLQDEMAAYRLKISILEANKKLALPPDTKLPLELSRSMMFVECYFPVILGAVAIVSLFLGDMHNADTLSAFF